MDDPKVNASQDAVVDMEGDLTLSQEAQFSSVTTIAKPEM